MGRIVKGLGLFILGAVVIGSIGGNRAGHASVSGTDQMHGASGPLSSFTAGDLALAYASNSVAADQRFKGRRYRVSGMVDNVNTNLWGSAYIVMNGGLNMFQNPQFTLEDSEKGHVASLIKGSYVTLVCDGSGDIAKTPMSNNCTFD